MPCFFFYIYHTIWEKVGTQDIKKKNSLSACELCKKKIGSMKVTLYSAPSINLNPYLSHFLYDLRDIRYKRQLQNAV